MIFSAYAEEIFFSEQDLHFSTSPLIVFSSRCFVEQITNEFIDLLILTAGCSGTLPAIYYCKAKKAATGKVESYIILALA